jgi:hypothetical protein
MEYSLSENNPWTSVVASKLHELASKDETFRHNVVTGEKVGY